MNGIFILLIFLITPGLTLFIKLHSITPSFNFSWKASGPETPLNKPGCSRTPLKEKQHNYNIKAFHGNTTPSKVGCCNRSQMVSETEEKFSKKDDNISFFLQFDKQSKFFKNHQSKRHQTKVKETYGPDVTEKIEQNPRQQSAQKITLKRNIQWFKASLSHKVRVLKSLQVSWISLYPFVEPEKNIYSFQVTSPPHHSFSETLWRNLNMKHWTCGPMNFSHKYKNCYRSKNHQTLAETCLNFDVNGKIKMTALPWRSPSNGINEIWTSASFNDDDALWW